MYTAKVEKSIPHAQNVAKATASRLSLKQHGPDKPFRTDEQKRAQARVAQLTRIYRNQYPNGLPNNRVGLKYATYMCRTLAFFRDVDHRKGWLDRQAPWLDVAERDRIAGLSAHWYSGRSLGDHLELYDDDRERLQAWTIAAVDVDDEERKKINRRKNRKSHESRRRAAGIEPRAMWLARHAVSRTEPWKALNISKATYYRRGLHTETGMSRPSLTLIKQDRPVSTLAVTQVREWPFCNHFVYSRHSVPSMTAQSVNRQKPFRVVSVGSPDIRPDTSTTYRKAA